MKKLLFLLLLIPFLGNSQATFTAPVGYNTGAPTATPSGVGTRWRFDLLTGKKYTWLPGTLSWDEDARGIDQVAGCSAPLYTPGYNQSTFAVNSCTVPELYQWTGAAWVRLNEGEVYTAGTGISISGGNEISNTAPDQTVTMTDGTGIDVTGTYPNFTVTNTSPNVVQTLSIAGQDLTLSGGGGTVAIPGVSWPLLAPDGTISAPSYSFTNSDETGLFYDGALNVVSAPTKSILVKSGDEIDIDNGAGSTTITAGNGTDSGGGSLNLSSGSSVNGNGGKLQFIGGTGFVGGAFSMYGGQSTGAGEPGGGVALNGGEASDGVGGSVTISGGIGTDGQSPIILNAWGVEIVGIPLSVRALITAPNPGTTIFCTDATANDASTGVMQVWNGATWKNAW